MLVTDPQQVQRWREVRTAVESGSPDERAAILAEQARLIRRSVLAMIGRAKAGHVGGDFSVADILATLYFGVMRLDPAEPEAAVRDRFILSKGHCAASLYSTLAFAGYFDPAELDTFMGPYSALNGHPNRTKVPGVETNTGPLGHGLPVAVGQALGARLLGRDSRVFVVCGDGEMQVGSNWEALMSAGHHALDNLTLVIDRNRLQQGARTEETNALDPLPAKLAAFGWQVREVDGHDHAALLEAFAPSAASRPVALVANTIKGKGASFMEDRVEWHHKVPTPEQIDLALKELA